MLDPSGYHLCDFCGVGIAKSHLVWDGGKIDLCDLHVPTWWAENWTKEVKAEYIPPPGVRMKAREI